MFRRTAFILFLLVFSSFVSFAQESGQNMPVSDETTMEAPKALPLQLTIESGAQPSLTGGKIVFDLVLTNVSGGALKTRKLDEKSVSCDINGQKWGSENSSGELVVVLMPGESIRRKFKVSGSGVHGECKVSCSYGMVGKGMRPSAQKTLNIVR